MTEPPNTPDAWTILKRFGRTEALMDFMDFVLEVGPEISRDQMLQYLLEETQRRQQELGERLALFKIMHDLPV